ncbi:MAG TPA: methyl-accepting chemotaxis protein [Deltaproteobacteria bacterium]|nr:methyl-accepting chemotaxis protein [Deltaproteobacteria bacterium]
MRFGKIVERFRTAGDGHGCRHVPPSVDRARQWADSIEKLVSRLGDVIGSSEGGFVELVEKLREFHARADVMGQRSRTVVELMSGEGVERTTVDLENILSSLDDHFSNPETHTEQTRAVITEQQSTMRRLSSTLDDLAQLVVNLSMLGLLTQVENAHLSTQDTGFLSLAHDVKTLALNIRDRTAAIRSRAEDIQKHLADTLETVSQFGKRANFNARSMLSQAMDHQRALQAKQKSLMRASRHIEEEIRSNASAIADIVMSLQFHDITRQQIEHVMEVLAHVSATIRQNGHSLEETAVFVRDALDLQRAQIVKSKDELSRAVANVILRLERIAENVRGILCEARSSTMASDASGMTFLEDLEGGITSVIHAIAESSADQERFATTVKSASETATHMSSFVKDIELLGLRLQLIALNARIKAANIGSEGAALDTISGSIYELSKSARDVTKTISSMLEHLVSVTGAFHDEFSAVQTLQRQTSEQLTAKIRELVSSLNEIDSSIRASMGEIESLGESLMRDLGDTTAGISLHEESGLVLDEVTAVLTDLIEQAHEINPSGHTDASPAFLAEFEKLYTMESERRVHQMHLEASPSASPETDVAASSQEGDLGDNVELF